MKKIKLFRTFQGLGAATAMVMLTGIAWTLFYSTFSTAQKNELRELLLLIAWTTTVFGATASTCVILQWAVKLPTRISWLEAGYGALGFSVALWMTDKILLPVYGAVLPIVINALVGVLGMLLACAAFSWTRKA